MEIIGQQIIPASRDAVWKALNDPAVLKQCLPGCESVEQHSPTEFHVAIKTAIGPLRARFQGVLRMAESNPPHSCVMQFEGQGGTVGFGKGTSIVTLRETPEGTELSYEAKAQVGGKLAQVGSRLIDSVAKKMTDDFFKAFRQQLVPQDEAVSAPSTTPALAATRTTKPGSEEKVDVGKTTPSNAERPMVPGWWLAPAASLGAMLAIAGSRFIH